MKTHFRSSRYLPKKLHRPYVRNRVSFTSQLYPNEHSSRSLLSAGASGSFSIKLLPLIAALGCAAATLIIVSKIKAYFE